MTPPMYRRLVDQRTLPLNGGPDNARSRSNSPESKEDLLESIQRLPRAEAVWVTRELVRMYPDAAPKPGRGDIEQGHTGSARTLFRAGSKSRRSATNIGKSPDGAEADQFGNRRSQTEVALSAHLAADEAALGHLPIVQFSNTRYFGTESEPDVPVQVIRLGSCTKRSVVAYSTRGVSAVPGESYEEASGSVTFEPGETVKTITLKLLPGEEGEWRTTETFDISLLEDGLQGARLGNYLKIARVYRLDEDSFPTSKYAGQKDVDIGNQMTEYLKMNMRNATVRRRTIKLLITDQLRSLFEFLHLVTQVYFVDHVMHEDSQLWFGLDRELSLFMVAALTVLPFFCEHVLDYMQLNIGVGGASRLTLQSALVRKYLNYDEDSRAQLSRGDLVTAISRDVPTLVADGYSFIFELGRSLGSIAAMTVFIFTSPYIFNKAVPSLISRIGVLILFPSLLAVVLVLRQKVNERDLEKWHRAMIALTDRATSIAENFYLSRDFDKREEEVDSIQERVRLFNSSDTNKNKTLLNSAMFAELIAVLVVAIFIPFRGLQVINGAGSLGMFLANLRIIDKYGKAWGHMYELLLRRQTAFPCLANLIRLLNMATDGPKLLDLTRRLTEQTLSPIKYGDASRSDSSETFDLQPIMVENLRHTYMTGPRAPVTINISGKLELQQGTLVCLMGPVGQGKSTVLRLLSTHMQPEIESTGSDFYFPSHLRALHVSARPLFFRGSLLMNLTYGVRAGSPDGDILRVKAICKLVGLPKEWINIVEQSSDDNDRTQWTSILSDVEGRLLSLARALVANPEVLVLEKPLQGFTDNMQEQMLRVLKEEYVNMRGAKQNPSTIDRRRPRTAIFTHISIPKASDMIDQAYEVNRDTGIQQQALRPGKCATKNDKTSEPVKKNASVGSKRSGSITSPRRS